MVATQTRWARRWVLGLLLGLGVQLGGCDRGSAEPTGETHDPSALTNTPAGQQGAAASKADPMTDEASHDQWIARLRALRNSDDPASVDELLKLCAAGNDDAIRDEAADHLWMKVANGAPRFSKAEPTPLQAALQKNSAGIRRLLDDELASVRRSGIQIVTELADAGAAARIRELAGSDPDPRARELAGKALDRLGTGSK